MKGLYHYTGCGLRNVWLRNGFVVRETDYGKGVAIHDVEGLHKVIGLHLIDRKPVLSGSEVRFLRKELDLPQSRLAQILGVSENSVRGWENNRTAISRPAERMLRVLYREHVAGDGNVRAIVDRLADLDRNQGRKLELEDTESGWRAAA
jgi:putative transcriptional regulator